MPTRIQDSPCSKSGYHYHGPGASSAKDGKKLKGKDQSTRELLFLFLFFSNM